MHDGRFSTSRGRDSVLQHWRSGQSESRSNSEESTGQPVAFEFWPTEVDGNDRIPEHAHRHRVPHRLEVLRSLCRCSPGDYNGDGTVDADDYAAGSPTSAIRSLLWPTATATAKSMRPTTPCGATTWVHRGSIWRMEVAAGRARSACQSRPAYVDAASGRASLRRCDDVSLESGDPT